MVSLCNPIQIRTCGRIARRNVTKVFCSMEMPPSQSTIKVVITGATKEIGRTAIQAVNKARGMGLAGAIDSQCIGQDGRRGSHRLFNCWPSSCPYLTGFINAGTAIQISGMEEPLEIPVLNDLTMVLGSIAQLRATGVVVDFSEPSTVYDNVKRACQLSTYKMENDRDAWLHQHYQLAQCSFNKLPYRPHSTTAMLRLWNQDLIHRICLRKMQYRLQITYQILVRYTTGKIWNPTVQQEARYLEKMECVYTVWFFQALLPVHQSTSQDQEKTDSSNTEGDTLEELDLWPRKVFVVTSCTLRELQLPAVPDYGMDKIKAISGHVLKRCRVFKRRLHRR